MSWDVFIFRAPEGIEHIEDLPSDWKPPALGTVAEVRAILALQLPGIAFDSDGRGNYDGPGFHIGVPLPDHEEDLVETVTLFIHGGPGAAGAALAVTEALEARAIETGSGDWLTAESAEGAFNSWRAYRDRVISGAEDLPHRESVECPDGPE